MPIMQLMDGRWKLELAILTINNNSKRLRQENERNVCS